MGFKCVVEFKFSVVPLKGKSIKVIKEIVKTQVVITHIHGKVTGGNLIQGVCKSRIRCKTG